MPRQATKIVSLVSTRGPDGRVLRIPPSLWRSEGAQVTNIVRRFSGEKNQRGRDFSGSFISENLVQSSGCCVVGHKCKILAKLLTRDLVPFRFLLLPNKLNVLFFFFLLCLVYR